MNKEIVSALFITFLLLTAPVSSFAVRVSGNVSIKSEAGSNENSDIDTVIIYLISTNSKKKYPAPKSEPKVFQKDKAFIPLVLPLLAGSTVEFENLDPYMHNVFSVSDTKSFDLGLYKLGDKGKKVKFDKKGIVNVYCNIHEQMMSFILVLDNPYFVMVDKSGKYSLDLGNLPTGDYKLAAWYRYAGQKTASIKLKSEDQSNINFDFIKTESIDIDKLKPMNN